MSKEFTKGQSVVYFNNHDSNGTWAWTRAIVLSCGTKRMHLVNAETEENMGNAFRPNSTRFYTSGFCAEQVTLQYSAFTMADMSDEEAEKVALEAASVTLDERRAHYARCLAGNHGEHYDAAIRRNLDALHEPRAIKK